MEAPDPDALARARARHDERALAHVAGLPRATADNPLHGTPPDPPDPRTGRRTARSRWRCPACGDGGFDGIGPGGSMRCAGGHWYLPLVREGGEHAGNPGRA